MDFTVYKVTPMGGPGGKRIMNLNLLLSTNSQNRNLQSFFAKTLNRIELPTVDPGWSCRQGSGLLLLTADVEKIAELAWFQVVLFKPLWCVRQTEDDSFPYSFRKIYCYRKPGSEIRKPCSRYALLPEAWFRDLTLYCSYAVPLPLYCGKFRITSCLYLFYFYF